MHVNRMYLRDTTITIIIPQTLTALSVVLIVAFLSSISSIQFPASRFISFLSLPALAFVSFRLHQTSLRSLWFLDVTPPCQGTHFTSNSELISVVFVFARRNYRVSFSGMRGSVTDRRRACQFGKLHQTFKETSTGTCAWETFPFSYFVTFFARLFLARWLFFRSSIPLHTDVHVSLLLSVWHSMDSLLTDLSSHQTKFRLIMTSFLSFNVPSSL